MPITDYLIDCHDLSLPSWGPYSKKYFGISHLTDERRGFRFDFSVMPGLYRRDIYIPDARKEAGYTPFESSSDLEYYSYRQQIEWKDRIFCDISFSKIDQVSRLMRCECVNQADSRNSFALHLIGGLELPDHRPGRVILPPESQWIAAVDNKSLHFQIPRPTDGLNYDGWRRGEELCPDGISGSCIGMGFGLDAGDKITFDIATQRSNVDILLRYRLEEGKTITFDYAGAAAGSVSLFGGREPMTASIYTGAAQCGDLIITSCGGADIKIEGIAIVPAGSAGEVVFKSCDWNSEPLFVEGPVANSKIIKFDRVDTCYGLWWSNSKALVRKYLVKSLKDTLLYDDAVHQHFMSNFNRGGNEKYMDILIQPVTVEVGSSMIIYAVLTAGTEAAVRQNLMEFKKDVNALEAIHHNARSGRIDLKSLNHGEQFSSSQEKMAAVTMTNVIYPVYTRRRFIRHSVPGRSWNSLYTWDSGFIGLGLLEFDTVRAMETLNTYVTEPGDTENAFICHGSPVPVQHYLLLDIYNRTGNRDWLRFFYPRLRQYYLFMAGKINGSTSARYKSGLLNTWDYFYNSGGWDDYPPQLFMHQNQLTDVISPVVTTAHVIRAGKILSMFAAELGMGDDITEYEGDITKLSQALHQYAWDADAGYFSYVRHDQHGNPVEIMRHESGVNFNMGMDGMTPLLSGICDRNQQELIFARLASPERFMTAAGLSTVDLTAPYYRRDGYWNGAVWMPYQWFFWKAALNEGKADLAWQIASTGLETWRRETDASHYCFEHFSTETGHGAGWHHFSGLSTPVLCWFGAYYRQGRLTSGYDVLVQSHICDAGTGAISARLNIAGNSRDITTLIATTGKDGEHQGFYNRIPCTLRQRMPGVIEADLPKNSSGLLEIIPIV